MRHTGRLNNVEDKLTEDLKRTTIPLRQLGKKYGVTYQAIFDFAKKRRIKRPRRTKREHTEHCSICQSLLTIAKKPHSDFITSQTIKEELNLKGPTFLYHICILRKKKLISPKFGRLHSRKAELAYQLYLTKRLPIVTIGKQVGLKNFNSHVWKHKALGWDVPDPLFKYDSNDRRKTALKPSRCKAKDK